MRTGHTRSMLRSASASMAATVMPCPYTCSPPATANYPLNPEHSSLLHLSRTQWHGLAWDHDSKHRFWQQVVQKALPWQSASSYPSPSVYAMLQLAVHSQG